MKKEPQERDLEEVERALSVLGGRHPEAVRAERQNAEAAAKRKREHEAAAAADSRRAMRRWANIALVLVAIGAVGVGVHRRQAKRAALEADVAPLVARYASEGFDALPRGSFADEDRAEVTTTAGDCYVFVAGHHAPMHVERSVGNADATGEALVCTCASENVVVTASGAAVRALHIAGSALGGTRALAYRFPKNAPAVLGGDDACADDALAAFARDGRYPKQESDGAWLAAHHDLAASGFSTVASGSARLPFVFVPPSSSSTCFFAASSESSELSLWTLDGSAQKPLQHAKALAWCAAKPATFIVERAPAALGTVTVVSAPSRRIGGLLGLREIAARAGLAVTAWVRDDERGEIAADALRASVVPEPTALGSQTITAGSTKDARLLVFSSAVADTFSSSEADFRCDPSLNARDSLCVQARPLTWHEPPPGVVCGAAYGPLPYWMSALADVRDPGVVDAELALAGFARRMAARGFAPGVIEGVTEREDSVEILGRSGEDAVVAVGLWPAPPFVHPYDEGAPWTLAGEPYVIPLAGGAHVTLRLREHPSVPLASRRTVVFRRSTK